MICIDCAGFAVAVVTDVRKVAEVILSTIASIGLLGLLVQVWRARTAIRGTTLVGAWVWSLIAVAMWLLAQIATTISQTPEPVLDLMWYATAVLTVCPFVAVLGARNPGGKSWTWFVVLPLVLVLSWPAWPTMLDLETRLVLTGPVVLGFLVVMLMGAGSYVGTRFTVLVIAIVGGVGSLLLWPDSEFRTDTAALIVVAGFITSIKSTPAYSRRETYRLQLDEEGKQEFVPTTCDERYGRLWCEFRDYYGLVWAIRVVDRLNQLFARDKLPVRLQMDGLIWNETPSDEADKSFVYQKADKSIFWILGRFVDRDWINARIHVDERADVSTKGPANHTNVSVSP